METVPKLAITAALAVMLASSTSSASPISVQVPAQASQIELVREDSRGSKTTTTRAWLRKKTNQTASWMGRQKRKLKNLVD